MYRRVDIYIPAACRDSMSRNPSGPMQVLYLIHGINGYEGSWQDKGFVADTIESMIASGRCRPMIIVMPDCNKWPLMERPSHGNAFKCVMRYPRLSREHEIEYALSDLMDMIDSSYSVSEQCYIAGLSDGARMSANLALIRPERILAVGMFSPVVHHGQLPKKDHQRMPMYYIYVGKNDIFASSGRSFHRRLNRREVPHELIIKHGNHNWRFWRQCLSDFLEKTE